MSLTAGTRLGPYEILSPIGAGGMGEVYKARDTRLERTVAVKVLPQHLSSSPEVRQRFEREARTISQLSHPHICALYDVGREGENEYLVMELLEGQTLSDRLAKGPLPLEQTLRFAVEMADALDKAHRQGIVHRDLKPGNVMLTRSGVKLLDFGLAKAMTPATPQSSLSSDQGPARPEIFVVPASGGEGKWQISTDGGTQPRWNRSGKEIFYLEGENLMAVPVIAQPRFQPGVPVKLFSKPDLQYFDVEADGEHFVLLESPDSTTETSLGAVVNWFSWLSPAAAPAAPR